ncbi:MAG: phage tail protein [Streptococcaceae bacterium]|jgi:phi13 family phage major tail protein|nr:phage tail protein [Streptococcaceae bacterium]
MPRIGVRDLFVAKVTADTPLTYTTATAPKRLAKAIQLDINPTTVTAELYADDGLDEKESSLVGMDISLNANDIAPGMDAYLLGKKQDENGAVIDSKDDQAPVVALMFKAPLSEKAGGGFEYRVLYCMKFEPYSETFQSKGENLTFQTPTITGKAIAREKDGAFQNKLRIPNDAENDLKSIAETWFTKPYEPTGSST